jgi:MerR family mercuric resistance operon transcriptional regulator
MKTIGKLAKELDINVETIRFYEKEGLISQPTKPENGYRLYGNAIKNNLKYIAKAKALGFTLKEISSLMSMENNPTIWLSAKFKYPFSYALPRWRICRR